MYCLENDSCRVHGLVHGDPCQQFDEQKRLKSFSTLYDENNIDRSTLDEVQLCEIICFYFLCSEKFSNVCRLYNKSHD